MSLVKEQMLKAALAYVILGTNLFKITKNG